ncbi:butyrate kinase [bacterium]|nr:butyrate kinase [bacterium]MBU1072884.1 butyrate kinase [bacterium]MBU1675901.1 butyrate kinase [bacterium]
MQDRTDTPATEPPIFDIERALEDQILAVMKNRPTVVLTEPTDPRIVEAACHLARFARLVFLAPESDVRGVVANDLAHLDPTRVEFTMQSSTFVDPAADDDLLDEFARECMCLPEELRRESTLEEAREANKKPSRFGIMAVRCGHADMVAGGMTHRPRDYFRPMLRLLQVNRVMCEAGVFVLPPEHPTDIFPHNIVIFGDVGVNATMTPETLARIAVGTCAVARDIIPEDVLPIINGAIVSYSHKGSDEGESPELVRRAAALVPDILAERVKMGERYASINIEGEVKISTALSRRSAMYYTGGDAESLSGRTNVIIAPNLDLGNLLFHLYSARYPEAKKFTAMFGIRFKGVDLPMDCTAKDAELAIQASILRLQKFGHWDRTPRDTFFPRRRILAVNPGSTSTRISVYEGDLESFTTELQHSAAEMEPYESLPITAQHMFRKDVILKELEAHGLTLDDLDAVAARGGLVRPIPHGTYHVNELMLSDLRDAIGGEHASNLGALIADELARGRELPAYIVDPVVVDEVWERAKITGLKEIRRLVISHALNQIATAQRYAQEHETFYESINVIVCHMGGGITAGAHRRGRYLDVNNGLNGEGPFTPQRSGSLPTGQLIDLCYSGKYTHGDLKQLNKGRGGLIDLLGTADLREVQRRIDGGDGWAREVFEAMAYQIAKEIAGLLPAFQGEPLDRVLLTGGMARSEPLVAAIESYLPPSCCGVSVYPGENEMYALVMGVLRVLNGKEGARTYAPEIKG